jgi:hypothetical protein
MPVARALIVLVVATAIAMAGLAPAEAASGYGYDVSYPQCGKTLPSSASFAVLGVNGGSPFKANSCLGEQFRWARRVKADYGFYVNSSNPGPSHEQWSKPGYYECGGAAAEWNCAYNFGRAAGKDAYNYAAKVTGAAAGHRFWVDVETANTWSKTDLLSNIAVLQGMVDYLTARSGRVAGIYASPNHWRQIANNAQATAVPNWFAAGKNRTAAADKCAEGGSLTGGPLMIVQFVVNGLDHDYWCGRTAG